MKQQYCKRGHHYETDGFYTGAKGSRICKKCNTLLSKERYRKAKENIVEKRRELAKQGMRPCSSCKQILSLDAFGFDIKGAGGYKSKCKQCQSEYDKIYRANNSDKIKLNGRRSYIKKQYGISLEEYEAKLLEQSNKCKICSSTLDDNSKALDHNHDTNAIRDFLCNKCNIGLGYFQDDINLLENAFKYLKGHEGGDANS